MLLNSQQIIEAHRDKEIEIEPFDGKQVQAATYDLRVGLQGVTTSSKKLVDIKAAGYITLNPGDFGMITILEEIKLSPQYTARFGLRSKFARKGLIATTGPQIDPGYHGRLIVGLTNLTPKPVTLPYSDDFVSVEFHKLENPTEKPYDGPYQDRLDLGAEEIEFITESEGMALSEVITTLRSLSSNAASLEKSVEKLVKEFRYWVIPVIIATLVAIVGILAVK